MGLKNLEARMKQADCMAIKQILHDGIAEGKPEDKRFWDGYAMCLENFSRALITNIQIKEQ